MEAGACPGGIGLETRRSARVVSGGHILPRRRHEHVRCEEGRHRFGCCLHRQCRLRLVRLPVGARFDLHRARQLGESAHHAGATAAARARAAAAARAVGARAEGAAAAARVARARAAAAIAEGARAEGAAAAPSAPRRLVRCCLVIVALWWRSTMAKR